MVDSCAKERRRGLGRVWRCQVKRGEGSHGCQKASGLSLGGLSWAHSAQCDVQPYGVTLGADLSIAGSTEEVSTRTEVVADGAERSQETLGVLSGFETLQYPLAFAGRQVRILRPIVQTLVSPVLRVRQHLSNGRQVACEFVRDHDARFSTQLTLKYPKQKAFSSCLITPLLDKDVEYDSVLIDGAP